MDKFKFDIFDIFGYIIPGALLLFSVLLIQANFSIGIIRNISNLVELTKKLNLYSFFLIILVAYVLGFTFHVLGYKYYSIFGKLLIKTKYRQLPILPISNDRAFVLIRHYSRENHIYVGKWYAFRAMSFNLSLAFLLLFFVIVIKLLALGSFNIGWILIGLFCLFFSMTLLYRAVTFHVWSRKTISETIDALNLNNIQTEIKSR